MHDIMVDIETTGTRPDLHGVIQLSAVRFSLDTGEVDPNFFDRCPSVLEGRTWDPGTRTWWMKHQHVLNHILARTEPAVNVWGDFAQWVGYQHETPPRFWAKPITFDFMFVQSHFTDLKIPSPFHYLYAVDLRSFTRANEGVMDVNKLSENEVQFEGDAHNGIADVIHQIKILFHSKNMRAIANAA